MRSFDNVSWIQSDGVTFILRERVKYVVGANGISVGGGGDGGGIRWDGVWLLIATDSAVSIMICQTNEVQAYLGMKMSSDLAPSARRVGGDSHSLFAAC